MSLEYLRKDGSNADWTMVSHTQSVSTLIDRTDSSFFPTRQKFPSVDTQINDLCQGRRYSRSSCTQTLSTDTINACYFADLQFAEIS